MKKQLRKFLMALCAAAMILSMVACSGPSNNSAPQDDTSTNIPVQSDPAETPTETPTETSSGIVRGGNLTFARLGNFNPNFLAPLGRTGDRFQLAPMYESLFFKNSEGEVGPNLATEYEWADDTTLLITLRDDVNYQDGGHMTAETVKYCLDWTRSEEAGATWRSELAAIESIEVVDTYKLQVNLSKADAYLLTYYANLGGIIVSPTAIDNFKSSGNGLDLTQGATGPFMMDLGEYAEGVSSYYVKNPNYYRMGEDGQPLPYLDSVTCYIIGDQFVKTTNLQSEDVLVADLLSDATCIEIADKDPNIVIVPQNNADVIYLRFNSDLAPFDDIRVRQAFSYAIDTQEIASVVTGSYGAAIPFVLTPQQWCYVDDGMIERDIEKAKSLLAEAGYADGLTVDAYYTNLGVLPRTVELLQMQLKEAGITINLQLTDSTAIFSMFAPDNEDTPAGLMVAKSGVPGVNEYVQLYSFFGENATRDASKMDLPEISALVEELKNLSDDATRQDIIKNIQKKSLEEHVYTHILFNPTYTAYSSRVHGIVVEGNAALYYGEAWIEPAS